jgi:TRAP-type uncharacterized transport system substrate-binding protein
MTMRIDRRGALALLAATALPLRHAQAEGIVLSFATAGAGSAFLPYGEGIAKAVARSGIELDIRESKGSNENLDLADASATTIGTASWARHSTHSTARASPRASHTGTCAPCSRCTRPPSCGAL